MLSDAFSDFTDLVRDVDADIPDLLSTLEQDLEHYADELYGYPRPILSLLRKAARRYAEGKLCWRALHAIRLRVDLCYLSIDETEESLIEDLRAFVRAKPTIDLRTKVGKICRAKQAAFKKKKQEEARIASAG